MQGTRLQQRLRCMAVKCKAACRPKADTAISPSPQVECFIDRSVSMEGQG
jgi:hypothetical protein